MVPINDGGPNEDHGQYQGLRVETKQALEHAAHGIVPMDAISGKPTLIKPDIEEQDRHESSEIEDILLDRNTSNDDVIGGANENMSRSSVAKGGCWNAKCGISIWKLEE